MLERRATLITVAILLALAATAWWWTVRNASDMGDTAQGLQEATEVGPVPALGTYPFEWSRFVNTN